MVFAKIRQTYNDMFQAEKKVADYIPVSYTHLFGKGVIY